MKKRMIPLFLCAALLLSGCGLLQREYTRTSPHSATYTRAAAGTCCGRRAIRIW